jgi:hypothetical protein
MNRISKYPVLILILSLFLLQLNGQKNQGALLLFQGLVADASSGAPLKNSQIFINRSFVTISNTEGKFAFYVNRGDTVVFKSLGYKSVMIQIADTLNGREFISGIFLNSDTLMIPEVVIVPRLASLKSSLLRPQSAATTEIENAKYNLAVSAYQAKAGQGRLGDPAMNYEVLRQKQKMDAYTKGQIPPDRMIGLSPLLLVPAAYFLINGPPPKPEAVKPTLSDQEVILINKKYQEKLKKNLK